MFLADMGFLLFGLATPHFDSGIERASLPGFDLLADGIGDGGDQAG